MTSPLQKAIEVKVEGISRISFIRKATINSSASLEQHTVDIRGKAGKEAKNERGMKGEKLKNWKKI